ncbi:MAG: hypothetical protein JOZ69_01700 [Myxococcales bacterium]|nr:hypothetical protein [Myxococcales bacterium]
MAGLKIHEDLASLVLVGNFNPAIFQPAWLAAKELIRESEAKGAVIEVIHPDIAQYRVDWLHVSVTRDRFSASTADPAHRAPLRDLVVGLFELLEQTPTVRLGINRSFQVDLPDVETWHALGHLVAPKEPWGGILENPGMRTLLVEAPRSDGLPGRTFFRVEPSQKYAHSVFVDVNSEYHPDAEQTGEATSYFVDRIRKDWDRLLSEARDGVEKLVRQVLKEKT